MTENTPSEATRRELQAKAVEDMHTATAQMLDMLRDMEFSAT